MKYAIFSDVFLSDFRLDDNGETLVLTDKRGYTRAVKLLPYEERTQGEWIDYDNTFYKCPDCGYLLEKCCPQCQNKVILPKGGAE